VNFPSSLLALSAPNSAPQSAAPANFSDSISSKAPADGVTRAVSALAAALLLGVTLIAFSSRTEASSGDRATLFFLALCAAVIGWTPARKYFGAAPVAPRADDASQIGGDSAFDQRSAASFALCAAMFLIYAMARRVAPENGPHITFALAPEDPFVIPYATMLVVPGALLCAIPARLSHARRHNSGLNSSLAWPRALATAMLLLGVFCLGSFLFLGQFYTVGATETLVPRPLTQALLQVIEYLALALLCHIATADALVRRGIFIVLPILLFAVWRQHYFAAPLPTEDAE
jgi:hypothetical protein